jgi:hypothetical protein
MNSGDPIMPFNRSRTSLAAALALPAVLAGCGGGSSSTPVAQAPHYTFTELTPPNGNTYNEALSINNSGQVLMDTRATFGSNQHDALIYYSSGTYTDLNSVDPQHNTVGQLINNPGQALYLADASNTAAPSIYSGGTGTALPTRPAGFVTTLSFADNGAVLLENGSGAVSESTGGAWSTVSTPAGFTSYQPVGLTPAGSVIASTDQGVVIDNGGGTFTHYGPLPSGVTLPNYSTAYTNASGRLAGNANQTAGGAGSPYSGTSTSGLTALPIPSTVLPGGWLHVSGISANGTIVGTGQAPGASQSVIVVWVNGQAYDVTPQNLPPLHNLVYAKGINDSGVICGYYTDSSNHDHAFLMTPTS